MAETRQQAVAKAAEEKKRLETQLAEARASAGQDPRPQVQRKRQERVRDLEKALQRADLRSQGKFTEAEELRFRQSVEEKRERAQKEAKAHAEETERRVAAGKKPVERKVRDTKGVYQFYDDPSTPKVERRVVVADRYIGRKERLESRAESPSGGDWAPTKPTLTERGLGMSLQRPDKIDFSGISKGDVSSVGYIGGEKVTGSVVGSGQVVFKTESGRAFRPVQTTSKSAGTLQTQLADRGSVVFEEVYFETGVGKELAARKKAESEAEKVYRSKSGFEKAAISGIQVPSAAVGSLIETGGRDFGPRLERQNIKAVESSISLRKVDAGRERFDVNRKSAIRGFQENVAFRGVDIAVAPIGFGATGGKAAKSVLALKKGESIATSGGKLKILSKERTFSDIAVKGKVAEGGGFGVAEAGGRSETLFKGVLEGKKVSKRVDIRVKSTERGVAESYDLQKVKYPDVSYEVSGRKVAGEVAEDVVGTKGSGTSVVSEVSVSGKGLSSKELAEIAELQAGQVGKKTDVIVKSSDFQRTFTTKDNIAAFEAEKISGKLSAEAASADTGAFEITGYSLDFVPKGTLSQPIAKVTGRTADRRSSIGGLQGKQIKDDVPLRILDEDVVLKDAVVYKGDVVSKGSGGQVKGIIGVEKKPDFAAGRFSPPGGSVVSDKEFFQSLYPKQSQRSSLVKAAGEAAGKARSGAEAVTGTIKGESSLVEPSMKFSLKGGKPTTGTIAGESGLVFSESEKSRAIRIAPQSQTFDVGRLSGQGRRQEKTAGLSLGSVLGRGTENVLGRAPEQGRMSGLKIGVAQRQGVAQTPRSNQIIGTGLRLGGFGGGPRVPRTARTTVPRTPRIGRPFVPVFPFDEDYIGKKKKSKTKKSKPSSVFKPSLYGLELGLTAKKAPKRDFGVLPRPLVVGKKRSVRGIRSLFTSKLKI